MAEDPDAPDPESERPDPDPAPPGQIAKSRLAPDLRTRLGSIAPDDTQRVILDFSADFPGGARVARISLLRAVLGLSDQEVAALQGPVWFALKPLLDGVSYVAPPPLLDKSRFELFNSLLTERYLFATLSRQEIETIQGLKVTVRKSPGARVSAPIFVLFRIWVDEPIRPMVYVSSRTIKCDAALAAFNSAGRDIVWAVADTGVAGDHPHFNMHKNLDLPKGLRHWDFTREYPDDPEQAAVEALTDPAGHGTHVAGIIAGESSTRPIVPKKLRVDPISILHLRPEGGTDPTPTTQPEIAGIAPECKIMSLKVLNAETTRPASGVSRLLAAIGYIQLLNGNGRNISVHGLNLSLGYDFSPESYGAGQSPICTEVNRLVKDGVVVVVSAGNGGSSMVLNREVGKVRASQVSSIMDPGNAELAITVGSTHRDRPYTFGVSYFSAKGPTADGRMKPDLVAPGELIVSCDATTKGNGKTNFVEKSGTSMAAPHVSGAIAAFLSVRREFRGQPERIKQIFVENASDLGRRPEFQGAGLVDLMRALQAV